LSSEASADIDDVGVGVVTM
jgi:hypothetical protein